MLGCAIAEALIHLDAGHTEGELSRRRASLVREAALAEAANALGLSRFLRLGEGELASGGAARASILADALEALIGAVFLDGGYGAAREAIGKIFGGALARLQTEPPAKDAKTRLQELLQARRKKLPEYRLVEARGAAHRQTFEVVCAAPELGVMATGSGASRRAAEQEAAERLLALLDA